VYIKASSVYKSVGAIIGDMNHFLSVSTVLLSTFKQDAPCCWLLAAAGCCWLLLSAPCWLPAAGCWLLAAGCWLMIADRYVLRRHCTFAVARSYLATRCSQSLGLALRNGGRRASVNR
jgi:hypothetical protein